MAAAGLSRAPRFLVVTTGAGSTSASSVQAQSYGGWRLANAPSFAGLRSVLEGAGEDYLLVLDAAQELREHALFLLAQAPGAGDADLLYGDGDEFTRNGHVCHPAFRPAWNPDLLLSGSDFGPCALRLAMAKRLLSRPATEIAFREELCGEVKAAVRAPFLVSRRATGRRASGGNAKAPFDPRHGHPGPLRRRHPLRAEPPLVSVIIPTKDCTELLRRCVRSLRSITEYPALELIVVDNDSRTSDARDYLSELEHLPATRVVSYPHAFNFSAINNMAVRAAQGELVALLNNDVEIVEPEWLWEMVSHALRREIGAVGARLLYPDRTIQHAGIILGINGTAGHAFRHLRSGAPGHMGRAQLVQNYSALTAACLAIRRETYLKVGGMDEQFAVAYNDVDFCLRVRALGLRNLYTPHATLIHHESKTRGADDTPEKRARLQKEAALLRTRWGPLLDDDPAYNPNLTLESEHFGLAWPPRVVSPWRR